jgi:hypothetical protein
MQYLGNFEPQHLHQIEALNPKLINPNHIERGKKLRLPGPTAQRMAENAKPAADKRNLR